MKTRKPLLAAAGVLAAFGIGYWATNNHAAPDKRAPVASHPPIQVMDQVADDPAALEEALQKNPTHTPVLLRMGQLALERGDADAAVGRFEEAVSVDPDNLDARLELGRALYEAGRVEEAVRATEAILAKDPNHVDALYNLGAMHANNGERDMAADYWRRAQAAAPDSESGRRAGQSLAVLTSGSTVAPDTTGTPAASGVDSETERLVLDMSRRSLR